MAGWRESEGDSSGGGGEEWRVHVRVMYEEGTAESSAKGEEWIKGGGGQYAFVHYRITVLR